MVMFFGTPWATSLTSTSQRVLAEPDGDLLGKAPARDHNMRSTRVDEPRLQISRDQRSRSRQPWRMAR
jgi:hypothetical protein